MSKQTLISISALKIVALEIKGSAHQSIIRSSLREWISCWINWMKQKWVWFLGYFRMFLGERDCPCMTSWPTLTIPFQRDIFICRGINVVMDHEDAGSSEAWNDKGRRLFCRDEGWSDQCCARVVKIWILQLFPFALVFFRLNKYAFSWLILSTFLRYYSVFCKKWKESKSQPK